MVVPDFSTKSIQQSTPISGVANTFTVTLTANFALLPGSTVTILGLTGSTTADDPAFTVTSVPDVMAADSGGWTKTAGNLVLTLDTATTASVDYVVTFLLDNPASTQSSPTAVSVVAVIQDSGVIASAAMTSPTTALYGVANGFNPLEVLVPVFSTKSIQQSTPMAGLPNTMTMTLTANLALLSGSTLTISGLIGSQTVNTSSLAVTPTSSVLGAFCSWFQDSGTLILTVAAEGTTHAVDYEVTFELYNFDTPQTSPTVNVVAYIQDSGVIALAAMTSPATVLNGLSDGYKPFTVVSQAIEVAATNFGPTPSSSLIVTGSRTGLYGETGTVRLQFTACEASVWTSGSHVVCRVPAGMFSTILAIVTLGENAVSATSNNLLSYDITCVSAVNVRNDHTTGLASVTVHGAGMGKMTYTGRARKEHTGCEATEWASDTSMQCQVGQGVQGSRRAVVTAGGQLGSVTHAWSADVPGLSAMQGVNRDPLGSTWVTVHGVGMGKILYTGRAREAHTGCEATEWASETSVRCQVGQGMQGSRRAVATAGERSGCKTQAWSTDVPGLSTMQGMNRQATGLASVTVYGAGMGKMAYTCRAWEGHTGCDATE